MHDGMSFVHACEWPALVTVPLDLPPSLDAVLFNVTSSSPFFFFDRSPFYLLEAAFNQGTPASSILFMFGLCLERHNY